MFDETEKYEQQDHFFWSGDEKLSTACSGIPEGAGIFTVYRLARGSVDLVYIGKSEMQQGRDLRATLLKDEIPNLETFFKAKFPKEDIEALDIYWFISMDSNHQDLPGYVQALLMQRYFEVYGSLPVWNREW